MNHAHHDTDGIRNTRPCLALVATAAEPDTQESSAGRCDDPRDTAEHTVNYPFAETAVNWHVREDRHFEIPDLLSDTHYDVDPQTRAAAKDHASDLLKTERKLDEALNLVGLMLAAIGDLSDARAMQTETGLNAVEKKLRSARVCLDKHDTRHLNLFLAYVDLRKSSGESEK